MRFLSTVVFSVASASASIRFSSLAAVAANIGGNSSKTSSFVVSATGDIRNPTEDSLSSSSSKLYSSSGTSENPTTPMIDPEYPGMMRHNFWNCFLNVANVTNLYLHAFVNSRTGTAVERMLAARSRVASLKEEDLNDDWGEVRRKILWAGGLRDLPTARPGQGYTGHSFNDYNHGKNDS